MTRSKLDGGYRIHVVNRLHGADETFSLSLQIPHTPCILDLEPHSMLADGTLADGCYNVIR